MAFYQLIVASSGDKLARKEYFSHATTEEGKLVNLVLHWTQTNGSKWSRRMAFYYSREAANTIVASNYCWRSLFMLLFKKSCINSMIIYFFPTYLCLFHFVQTIFCLGRWLRHQDPSAFYLLGQVTKSFWGAREYLRSGYFPVKSKRHLQF